MPLTPPILDIKLERAQRVQPFNHLRGTALNLRIQTPPGESLTGATLVKAELHDQTTRQDETPLARQEITFPSGTELIVPFSAEQMNQPTNGAKSVIFWLLVEARFPATGPHIFELIPINLMANPMTHAGPPPEIVVNYPEAAELTGLLAAFLEMWVPWPLSSLADSKGRPGSHSYNPATGRLYTKVSNAPHTWVYHQTANTG